MLKGLHVVSEHYKYRYYNITTTVEESSKSVQNDLFREEVMEAI